MARHLFCAVPHAPQLAVNEPHAAVSPITIQQLCCLSASMQGASLSAVSMLREAVNLSPEARLMPASATDADTSESETDTSATALHTCDLAQEESAGNVEAQQQQQQQPQQQRQQQGQEAGRGEAMLREAYKEMLLQQQSRHRSELERRQAKHQRQLDTQVQQHSPETHTASCCESSQNNSTHSQERRAMSCLCFVSTLCVAHSFVTSSCCMRSRWDLCA